MTNAGTTIIDIAQSQVGVCEEPPFSNRTPYNAYFGRQGEPWCAFFVSWCFARAGLPLPDVNGPNGCFAYCPSGQQYALSHGEAVDRPEAGDIVLFDFYGEGEPGHVGLFVRWRPDGGLETIEGNTNDHSDAEGDAVRLRVRWASQVSCYWRPAVLRSDGPMPGPEPLIQPVIADLPTRVIGRGARSGDVAVLQRFLRVAATLLQDRTIDPGPADGDFGPRTESAVRAWQRTVSAVDDGTWGPQTLRASSTFVKSRVPQTAIGYGATGLEVTKLQRLLRRMAEVLSAPAVDPVHIDGEAGPLTTNAIAALERSIGGPVDRTLDIDDLTRARRHLEDRTQR